MRLTIPIAHDFTCPWCWVGWKQAVRLQKEFGVDIEWLAFPLWPDELEWPEPGVADPVNPNRPKVPSRFEFLLHTEGITLPDVVRPRRMRTVNTHHAVEFAKSEGVQDALVGAFYQELWEKGTEIGHPDEIMRIATGIVTDLGGLRNALKQRPAHHKIVGFDDPAYAAGVYNVPTFFIGGERYAEQPYAVLADAVANVNSVEAKAHGFFESVRFPSAPSDRPYVFIDMITTIDGKILSGDRNDPVADLGSPVDHKTMANLEGAADGVLIGAQTLRATAPTWNPRSQIRVVATRSGDLPWNSGFLSNGQPILAVPGDSSLKPPNGITLIAEDDLAEMLRALRQRGVERLLVLGGSELNAQLLHKDLVDELFWTIAPKVKLGRDVPTYADGDPLPKESLLEFDLLERHTAGEEVFLRYRRRRA